MRNYFTRKSRQHFGFTLMETLLVVALLAIIVTITVTSIVVIRKNMQFKQCNDSAHAIYMASQTNLTQMRSMGELPLLEEAATNDDAATFGGGCYYSYSKDADSSSYDLIVPASLDSTVRNQQVIIEYHPTAGIIYSVFYYEGTDSLEEMYLDNLISRDDADARKDLLVGYYSVGEVDAINSEDFTLYQIPAEISYTNDEEGIITISVPVKDSKDFDIFTDRDGYVHISNRMEIELTVTGQNGGQFTKMYNATGNDATKFSWERDYRNRSIIVKIPLDSLPTTSNRNGSFTVFGQEMTETGLQNPIASGENISVTADVTFTPDANDPIILINSATIAGINPLYHSLTENPDYDSTQPVTTEKPYILAVSNGRHLQNLAQLDATFANQIDSIIFTNDDTSATENILDWSNTTKYYTENYSNSPAYTPVDLSHLSYIPEINGNDVQIKQLEINTAKGGNAGLFAFLKNATVTNITLVDPSINASSANATGALIGTAEGVTITNCSVTSNNSFISGNGAVGGLVGVANTGTTLDSCTSAATVKGADNVASNIGGVVGSATGATFTACTSTAYVEGVDNGHATTVVGGFVGTSIGSTYNQPVVTLSRLPQNAEHAGGFAGTVSGGKVTDLNIVYNSSPNTGNTSKSVTNFGGVASRVESGARFENTRLLSKQPFNNVIDNKNSKVAGAFVSILGNDTTINYAKIYLEKTHSGLGNSEKIQKAGFAVENAGTITHCFSNVRMEHGSAFVKTNNKTVRHCYAWVWGEDNVITLSNCGYSYFVDGTATAEGDATAMVMYEDMNVRSKNICDTEALASDWAISILNSSTRYGQPWAKQNGYPYPALGNYLNKDWGTYTEPAAGKYPYALRYVETYSDNSTGEMLIHYSDEGVATIQSGSTLKNNVAVKSAAYYLCHREDSLANATRLYTHTHNNFDTELAKFKLEKANGLFTIYQLNNDTDFTNLKLNTYYPLYDANSYRIRTAEQFKNIAANPGSEFYLDNVITIDSTVDTTFTGKLYGADSEITANAPLFAQIAANATIINCKITTSLVNPFGTFNGAQQLTNATHWATDANVTAYVDGFESKFTAFAGTAATVPASLTGCTINGNSILRHFYSVNTTETKEQLTPVDVSLTSVEATADLLSELAAGTTPVSGYYVNTDSTSYEPLVAVTYSETTGTYVVATASVSDTIVDKLYTTKGSIPTDISGSCYIMVSGKYLTANGSLVDVSTDDCTWIGNSNGTYTNSGSTISAVDIFKLSGQFTIQKIALCYDSTYLGSGIAIAP